MDPITIAGLIASIQQLVTGVYKFGQNVHEAKDEISKLCSELFSLKAALEHIQVSCMFNDSTLEDKGEDEVDGSSITTTPEFSSMLSFTEEVLQDLLAQIDKRPNKLKDPLRRLAWPFRKQEVERYVSRLERAKSWFILAVTTNNSIQLRELCNKICSVDRRLELRENVEHQRAIEKWLAPHDSYSPLEKALKNFQLGTGDWFLDRTFEDWLRGHTPPILWLVGKSGAGKTTLLSAAIQKAQMLEADSSDVSVVYFFFCFSEQESRYGGNIFGSFLMQLCQKHPELWPFVEKMYKGYLIKSRQQVPKPDLQDLIDTLSECLALSPKVLFFLDAVNESQESEVIIQSLKELVSDKKGSIKAIITSTEDIQASVNLAPFGIIKMRQEETVDDIKKYIDAQLENVQCLRDLPLALKSSIGSVLRDKAAGSFRFVYCQLEALTYQKTARDVRQALENTPSTLGQTYRNILARIPQDDAHVVKQALLWISLSLRAMRFNELCEAVIIPEEEGCPIDNDMRLLRPESLLRACGSLIAYDNESTALSLAHPSVWFYLSSNELKNSDVKEFYIDAHAAENILTRYCINYMLNPDFEGGYCSYEDDFLKRLQNWPLLTYIARTLYRHLEYVKLDDSMKKILKRFFLSHTLPRGGNFSSWVQAFQPDYWGDPNVPNAGTIESSTPLYYAARAGLLPVVRLILDLEGTKNLETPGGVAGSTPLHVASWQGHTAIVQELLKAGANAKETNVDGLSGLFWASVGQFKDVENLLRAAGAEMSTFLEEKAQQLKSRGYY